MTLLHFEDFTPGATATYPGPTLSEEEIVAFARAYDPQPMHTDADGARETFAGELIASGWQTACLHMRMLTDDFILRSACLGSGGVDELRWTAPVRPGDTLQGRRTVLETIPSRSRPDRGAVRFRFEIANQHGARVMTIENPILFARRDPGPDPQNRPAPEVAPMADDTLARAVPAAEQARAGVPALSAIPTTPVLLGEGVFDAEGIVAFARRYDPQSFHLSEEAGRASHFGGLVASGWQTASGFMAHFVRFRMAQAAASREAGVTPPKLGPSPGVRNLRWLAPVRPGDVIRYTHQHTGARRLANQPGWGLALGTTCGWKQTGEKALSLDTAVLWEETP